jgi:RHS repeat-associated protein
MRTINYSYRGSHCNIWEHPPSDPPLAKLDYFLAEDESIAAERSGDHVNQFNSPVVVSSFSIGCWNGQRVETNGFGAFRWFYFGRSAGIQGDVWCHGYQLGKLTDFTYTYPLPADLPFRHQNGGDHPLQEWDGLGIMTSMEWDSGNLAAIHYADTSSSYNDWANPGNSDLPDTNRIHNTGHHWLFKKTDERNLSTTYRRDSRRRITDIGHPDGSSEHFDYNEWNQVTSHTMPSGAIQTYEYDGFHRLQREHNSVDYGHPAEDYKFYTYYGPGNHPEWTGLVEKVIEGRARRDGQGDGAVTARMTYNGRHQVTSVEYASTDNSHPTVQYQYDHYGNCIAIIDEWLHRKDFTYDSYRRCTSYTEQLDTPGWDGNGTVASRRWDWIYDRYIDGLGLRGAYTHTSKEWRVQIEPEFNEAHERRMTARWFDMNNRIILEQTGWIQPGQGPLGTWYTSPDIETHRFTYDKNGQKHTYTDPRNRTTTYVYNERNRLWKTIEEPMPGSDITSRTTETQYDPTGNKVLVRFPDGKTQQWPNYTAFGQPLQFIDELGKNTDLTYLQWGPMKKLHTVTTHRETGAGSEDQVTTFSYDPMGRPTQTLFPDNSKEVSTYEFGQLQTWQNRRGWTKFIDYDVRGREASYSWDDGRTSSVSKVWDKANRLQTIGNNVSLIDYTYDSAGQVLVEGSIVRGSAGTGTTSVRKQVSYCRYPSGEVSRLTYPNGSTIVHRAYTARGQLHEVGSDGGSVSYTYLPDGKVENQVYTTGVQTHFEYDGRGMIKSVSHKKGTQNLAYREYWRDDRDRITAWKRGTDYSLNHMEDGRGDRYGYDWDGQLTNAVYRALDPETDNPREAMRGDVFQYDALGNRWGWNNVANRGQAYFALKNNGLNQYHTWFTFPTNYDDDMGGDWGSPGHANGVLMQEGYITASFNALNQPMAIFSPAHFNNLQPLFVWFGYDPLGRCVKRWIGSETDNDVASNPAEYFYYDGWNLIQEGSSANNAAWLYVHGGRVDEIVASHAGGTWNYHHYDARGHCILLTNTNGDIREQYDYDAFGFPYFYRADGIKLVSSEQWGNRFLFTGREWLSDLRIYDFRNRMYQPELGRFLQPDSKEFDAGDYNLYRYCHNDPVNKSDPTGLMPDALVSEPEARDVAPTVVGASVATIGILAVAPAVEAAGGAALTLAGRIPILARAIAALSGAAAGGSRINLKEGSAFIAVVSKDGKIAGTGSIASSHAALVQKVFGGNLPQGATAVTVGKLNGQIFVQTSRTFSGNQLPAAKHVIEAIKKKYE